MPLKWGLGAADYTYYARLILEPLEPHFPWRKDYLRLRAQCYAQARHPAAARTRAAFEKFERNGSRVFVFHPPGVSPPGSLIPSIFPDRPVGAREAAGK